MNVTRVLFIFTALVGVGIGLVWLRTEVRQNEYLKHQSRAQQQELKRTCLDLELEQARLRSPSRLETENGRRELDLSPPAAAELARSSSGPIDD